MKFQVFLYKCGTCNQWFEAPEVSEFSYGQFLLRSENDESRYLNANIDEVFLEVDALLAELAEYSTSDQSRQARILHIMFGVSCDCDSYGMQFEIGRNPKCRWCDSSAIVEWKSPEPPQYIDADIPSVTHRQWQALSKEEKRTLIRNALDSLQLSIEN